MSRKVGSKNLKPSKAQLYQALDLDSTKNIEAPESKGLPPSFGRI